MASVELGLGLGDLLGQFVDTKLGPIESLVVLVLIVVAWYYFKYRLPAGKEFSGTSRTARASASEYHIWRAGLLAGGKASEIYASLLTRALSALDRFYGDGERPANGPSATFTGPSLDRSLIIGLVYPIITVVAVWYSTGISGPVEQTLGFPDRIDYPLGRLVNAASIVLFFAICFWPIVPSVSNRKLSLAVIGVQFVAFLILFAGTWIVADNGGLALIFAIYSFALMGVAPISGAVLLSMAVPFVVVLGSIISQRNSPESLYVFLAFGCFSVTVTLFLGIYTRAKLQLKGLIVFCMLYLIAFPILVFWLPRWINLSAPQNWMLLVFCGALPIINALFDWFSLGITRFLLRRGQGKTGFQPVLYAALDLYAAVVMLALVMLASLGYVQVMNAAAGQTIVDVDGLLNTLRTDPANPTVWWVYVTIFTTMVPSLVNLFLGGLAIVRGLPSVTLWIANTLLPVDPRDLTLNTRFMATAALTFQASIAGIGALGVAWIGWWIVSTGMGLIGLGLLPMAEALNDFIKSF